MKPALLAGVALAVSLSAQAPDNSKMNQRDRAPGAVTADQQKMNSADRNLAQKIRKSVTADKTLSLYAHNVKIITRDGAVTLRGPVRTEAEREEVGKKAIAIAGMSKVTNELEIAPVQK